MNFARAHDQYLTPPEEPEAVLCDECGEEMQIDSFGAARYMKCVNQFCPAKFEGVAREMAELLIGAREEVKKLARQVKLGRRDTEHLLELGKQHTTLEKFVREVANDDLDRVSGGIKDQAIALLNNQPLDTCQESA